MFLPKKIKLSKLSISKINESFLSKQPSSELNVLKFEKIFPESKWAFHCCLNRIFNNSNQGISNLFQTMFSDSKIAKSFEMGPSKTG